MRSTHITSYLTISSLTSAVLRLSPRIMQILPSLPFMPCYLCMRHLLKLDIFLTSVRQSWTELHEGAAIWILGKQLNHNKIQRCECLVDRQGFFFFFSYFMCAVIESAQSGLLYHEDGLKSCCLKKIAGSSLVHWWVSFTGKPESPNWSSALYTVLLYIEHCIRFIEKLLFDFFSCAGYMSVGINFLSKPQIRHALSKSVLKIILFFFFFLYCR